MKIYKQVEWDMGHRVTNHKSVCRNIHGHRYKAEICVEGKLVNTKNVSDEGMVMDFGEIKNILNKHVHDVLDHGFMLWNKDEIVLNFFKRNVNLKYIIVPFVPTAENIATWIFSQIDRHIKNKYGTGLRLYSVKVWETPTNIAECKREDLNNPKNTNE